MSFITMATNGSAPGTPPTGYFRLYAIAGQGWKYKDDAGNEYAIAVTAEDVQDVVGALIQAGSSKVTVNYNDTGNALSIDVVPGNILHQQLSGAGSNTHAQIDSHIANTGNPHATTAAQVGADTVGSAAAAQAFSIQRSNHTGTQLASTISDFAATVRSTVLTGISFVDSLITAADSVLVAIGKIQGQLNQRVSDFNATIAAIQADMDLWTELSTTGDLINGSNVTFTNVTELQFPVVAGRRYYIEVTVKFRTAVTTTGIALTMGSPDGAAGDLAMQVNIPIAADGTAAIYGGSISSLGDTVTGTGVQTAQPTWFCANMKGAFVCTTGGNLNPQFRSEVNGSNVNFGTGSVILVREFA